MEMAAGMWLLSNHENYCAKLTQLVELGEQKSEYFSPSWTAFQADRGRYFSVIVDGVSV